MKVGADTVIPFSGGGIGLLNCFINTAGGHARTGALTIVNPDGTAFQDFQPSATYSVIAPVYESEINNHCEFVTASWIPNAEFKLTAKKAGYYLLSEKMVSSSSYTYYALDEPIQANVGTILNNNAPSTAPNVSTNYIVIYLGETNPFA